MTDTSLLQRLLIALETDQNVEVKQKVAIAGIRSAIVEAELLVSAAESLFRALPSLVMKVTAALDNLFFASQRTRTAATELQAFRYAAQQTGSSMDEILATIESFAEHVRHHPGALEQIRGFDVRIEDDAGRQRQWADILFDFVQSLGRYSEATALHISQQFGVGTKVFDAFRNPDFIAYVRQERKMREAMGLLSEESFAQADRFQGAMTTLSHIVSLIFEKTQSVFFARFAPDIERFLSYLEAHGAEIASALANIANAVVTILEGVIKVATWIDRAIESTIGWKNALLVFGAAIAASLIPKLLEAYALVKAIIAAAMSPLVASALPWLAMAGGAYAVWKYGPKGLVQKWKKDWTRVGENMGFLPKSGGGGGDYSGVRGTPASGNLKANQQEAYTAALEAGLDKGAAEAMVANMSGEALRTPGIVNWDVKHWARGIAQWDPTRAARIKAQFGRYPNEMSVAEQTKAALWEMRLYYPRSWAALKNPNLTREQKVSILVTDYERPRDTGTAIRQRVGFLHGLDVKDKRVETAAKKLGDAIMPKAEAAQKQAPSLEPSKVSAPEPPKEFKPLGVKPGVQNEVHKDVEIHTKVIAPNAIRPQSAHKDHLILRDHAKAVHAAAKDATLEAVGAAK